MTISYEIAFMINQCFDIFFISFSLLAIIFMSIKISFNTAEDLRRKNKVDIKNKRRIKIQKEHLTEILSGISKRDKVELIQQLNKKEFDLFLIFKLPQYKLSHENTLLIHTVLNDVFQSNVDDKYLSRWFDWWIKDYVNDVFLPVLEDIK